MSRRDINQTLLPPPEPPRIFLPTGKYAGRRVGKDRKLGGGVRWCCSCQNGWSVEICGEIGGLIPRDEKRLSEGAKEKKSNQPTSILPPSSGAASNASTRQSGERRRRLDRSIFCHHLRLFDSSAENAARRSNVKRTHNNGG